MLEKESEDAFDERRLLALKLGEEAGTKMCIRDRYDSGEQLYYQNQFLRQCGVR